MSFNYQSINAKFDEFQLFIEQINDISPLSVISLQERWLDDSTDVSLFNLPGYKLINQGKSNCSTHGGLMIYVNEKFNVSAPLKLVETVTGWEYLCVEITQLSPYPKKYIIANIYRPLMLNML